MTLNLALVISGNAAGGKQAIQETRAEVRGLGADAAATSGAMRAANDQAVASSQRVVQALTAQTEAQRKMQAAVADFAGIKPANDDAGYRQRQADIEAYGQELDRIRAKYNPLFAVERQHLDLLRDIDNALKIGAISEQDHAAAVTAAGVAHQRQIQLLGSVSGAARLTSAQLLNLSRQGNDVVTMWLLGASAGQIAVSQFGQVYDALESGPKGLRGSLEAIAVAGRNALSALLAFAVTPPGLVAAATVAAVAGLTTYIVKTREDVRDLDEVLKDHEAVIKGIADAYGLAQSKAHGAFTFNARDSFGLSAAADLNDLKLTVASSAQNNLSGILTNRGTGGSGNQFGPAQIISSEFAPFSDAINHLRSTARAGEPDILGFKRMVEARWALEPNNVALIQTGEKLRKMIADSVDAARALKELEEQKRRFDAAVGPGGIPLRRGELSTEDMGAYDQYLAAQRIQIERGQQAFDAQRQAIYARSPSEIGAAARAAAATQYNDDEDPQARTRRINMDGQLAELRMLHDLTEAQRERKRSVDETLASARLDVELVGKSQAETARLRMEHELLAQVRAAADVAGVKADEDEIARIRQKAAEYGRLVALQQARDMLHGQGEDIERLRVEQALLGASETTRARVTAQLKAEQEIRRRGIDVMSSEADRIRANAAAIADMTTALDRQKGAWDSVKSAGESAIDSLVDGDWKSAADDIIKTALQLNVANPLKNWIFGSNEPTGADLGSNLLGRLFGGGDKGAGDIVSSVLGKSVGEVNLNAAVVNIGGAGVSLGSGGSLWDGIKRVFAPANGNAANGAGGALPAGSGGVAGQIWNFFAGKGLKDFQIAGIMGNFGAESSFNPAAVNPSSGATGIAQWLGPRLAALGPGANLADQLKFAWSELQGPESRTLGNLLGSTDVRGATRAFAGFERAEGFSWRNPEGIALWDQRLEGAQAALEKFGGTAGDATRNLGQFGAGLGQMGQNLSNVFPAAPASSGGGGLGGLLSSLFGGGGLNNAFSGSAAFNWLSANPGGYIGLYDVGGATGGNDPRRVAGLVHEKEYVMDEPVVRVLGVPFLDRLRAAAKSGRGYMSGGAVEGGAALPMTGTYGGAGWGNPVQQAAPMQGRSVVRIELAPELRAEILQQASDQSVQIVQANNQARADLYQNGDNPR